VPGVDDEYPPSVVDDELVTHEVVAPELVPAQAAALAHHATQVTVRGETYALSNDIAARLPGREGFALLDPATGKVVAARRTGAAAAPRRTGLVEEGL
jgi:N-acetyl-1-D-myo-inositol-2-amino-2-deoxy-alpha-D-glucopyranoside deacetylase